MIRIAFVLCGLSSDWLGGINYFKNLFSAIDSLPNSNIKIVIVTGKNSNLYGLDKYAGEVIRTRILDRYSVFWLLSKSIKFVLRREYLFYSVLLKNNIHLISHFGALWKGCSIPSLMWIPDFQHIHLKELFSKELIDYRDKDFNRICKISDAVLVSSCDSKKDLYDFLGTKNINVHVLRFVSTVTDDITDIPTLDCIKEKYNLNKKWFHIPNQVWQHKNHILIINSLNYIKAKNRDDVVVVFTGSTGDFRSKEHFIFLNEIISKYKVEDYVIFLGVIPYIDVMALMKYSIAVINPSFFEGWSSTVEEAKSLGKKIFLSDIPVHREQNPDRGFYFNTNDHVALANLMIETTDNYQTSVEEERFQLSKNNMEERRRQFAIEYQNIATSVLQKKK